MDANIHSTFCGYPLRHRVPVKCYTMPMHDETVEQIQTKIAYLEKANAELGDLVFRQHQDILSLVRRVEALADRLNAALSDERRQAPEQERPPHY